MPPALASVADLAVAAFAWSASCPPSGEACSSAANSWYSSYFFERCSRYSSAPYTIDNLVCFALGLLPPPGSSGWDAILARSARKQKQEATKGGRGPSTR